MAGYRLAAYHGVLYTALALFGWMITTAFEATNLIGIALILLALYLQGKIKREKIWTDEKTLVRLLGAAPIPKTTKGTNK